eukprot:TCONS_00052501-protein
MKSSIVAISLAIFSVLHTTESLKCYGLRTKNPSPTNLGKTIECPQNVTHCVTGIGTIGQRGERKEFEMLGRACFAADKAKQFCTRGRNCQYMVKSDGSIFKLCYHCCETDLCNHKMPGNEKNDSEDSPDSNTPEQSSKQKEQEKEKKRKVSSTEDEKQEINRTSKTNENKTKETKKLVEITRIAKRRIPTIIRLKTTKPPAISTTTKRKSTTMLKTTTTIPTTEKFTEKQSMTVQTPTESKPTPTIKTSQKPKTDEFETNKIIGKKHKPTLKLNENTIHKRARDFNNNFGQFRANTIVQKSEYNLSKQNISIKALSCHKDKMTAYLNVENMQKDFYIILRNSSCRYFVRILNIVQNTIEVPIDYHSCGTIMVENEDHVTYSSQLSFAKEDLSVEEHVLTVKCSKKKLKAEQTAAAILEKGRKKPYQLSLHLFKKSTYLDEYYPDNNPISIPNYGWVFSEVRLASKHDNNVLKHLDCLLRMKQGEKGERIKEILVIENLNPVNRSVRIIHKKRTSIRFRIHLKPFTNINDNLELVCFAHASCDNKEKQDQSSGCEATRQAVTMETEYVALKRGRIQVVETKVTSGKKQSGLISSETTRYIILGCVLGMIFILTIACVAINKHGWAIRINNDSESGDSHDSQPEKSPVKSVTAVLEAESPGTSGLQRSKENTAYRFS